MHKTDLSFPHMAAGLLISRALVDTISERLADKSSDFHIDHAYGEWAINRLNRLVGRGE
jgi:hypothetical protein